MINCCKPNDKNFKRIEESIDILKAISEPNRLRILYALSHNKTCVCKLADLLDMQQNLMSFHLKTLHEVGILDKKREGNNIYYVINKKWNIKINNIFRFLEIK